MNAEVEKSLNGLIATIQDTDSYKEYRKQLALVNQDPQLKAQIDDFRKRNFDMQMAEDMDFAKLSQFEKEFKGFRENPLVDNFLAAELDFCRLLQEIDFCLVESMDFQ